jgi:hypothetical protein
MYLHILYETGPSDMSAIAKVATVRNFELISEQDRKCTYKVTLRRVHETIVVVEKQ